MDSQNLLDEMVNGDSVQILKAALPYLPSSGQSVVSVFAKFLELQNTIHFPFFQRKTWKSVPEQKSDPVEMLTACSNACHGPAKEKLNNMINTLLMLQMLELSQKPLPPNFIRTACMRKEANIAMNNQTNPG